LESCCGSTVPGHALSGSRGTPCAARRWHECSSRHSDQRDREETQANDDQHWIDAANINQPAKRWCEQRNEQNLAGSEQARDLHFARTAIREVECRREGQALRKLQMTL
jgi:hypothetical protein